MVIAESLGLGLVTSAVYDALKRPLLHVRHAKSRRTQIGNALREQADSTKDDSNSLAQEALAELVRVLAHDIGQYSEKVASFVKELEKSSIPLAIAQASLCSQSPNEIYPAFLIVYNSFAPLPFQPAPLFDALSTAVAQQILSSTNDRGLTQLVRAQSAHLLNQIDDIKKSLAAASNLSAPLTFAQYNSARLRLAKSVEVHNRDLPIETDRGTKRVLISKLVIPARLRLTDNSSPSVPTSHSREDNTIGFIDFRRSIGRAIVLGDPGGGKSTLTQNLCYEMAHQIGLESSDTGRRQNHNDLRLPLKIIIRNYERKNKQATSYSIIDYLVDDLAPVLEDDRSLTKKFLVQALVTGQCLVIFDGLDEILDVDRRRQIVALVEQFSTVYASCPFLVTSRVVGYRDAPLSDIFDAFNLTRLNAEEIRTYSTKMIKAIGGPKKSEAATLADEFVKQTTKTASDLRENPLLLGLMVYIYMQKGAVPDNRPEIYRECSILMFQRWDQRRDIRADYDDDFELMDLFGFIAVEIFGNSDAEAGVTETWLTRRITNFFEEWYGNRPKAVAAARSLVSFITGRAWVMCDVGPGTYKFTHRTFLEYFVARRIESESESVAALIQRLYQRIIRAEWDVVSHLALQIATSSGPKSMKAAEALAAILASGDREPDAELNLLFFLAHALEYLAVPEAKYEGLASSIYSKSFKLGASYDIAAIGVFALMIAKSKKKIESASKLLRRETERWLKSDVDRQREFAYFLVGARSVSYVIKTGEKRVFISDETGALFAALNPVRAKYENQLWKSAQHDARSARLYAYTYQTRLPELYSRHNGDLFFQSIGDVTPEEFQDWHLRCLINACEPSYSTMDEQTLGDMIDKVAADILNDDFVITLPAVKPSSYSLPAHLLSECVFWLSRRLAQKPGRQLSNSLARRFVVTLAFYEAEAHMNVYEAVRRVETPPAERQAWLERNQDHGGEWLSNIHDQATRDKIAHWISGKSNFVRYT